MVNVIKDIVNKLDGTSYDNQGFAVTSYDNQGFAVTSYDNQGFAVTSSVPAIGSFIKLQVKPYIKHEGTKGLPEEEHLMEMINRLLSHYSGGSRYAVCKAEKVVEAWELLVQEVQEKTEDKDNEVQGSLQERQIP